jgi:hypothetical protein
MAFIGTPLDTRNTFQSLQGKRFNGDGSTTDFTLDVAPGSTLDIEVFVGNVRQDPNSAYTLSGTTLSFTGAPPSGTNNIYVVHQAKAVGTIGIPDDTISARTLVTLDNSNDHVLIEDATDGELKKALIPSASFAGIDDQSSSNDDQLTITDTAVVINEDSDDVDFRVESNGNANMLFVSGGNDVVGVGNEGDLGVGLHIKTADSTASSPNSGGDELIIENSDHAGLSILTAVDKKSSIYFGDAGNASRAYIEYNHDGDKMAIAASSGVRMEVAGNGTVLVGTTTALDMDDTNNGIKFDGANDLVQISRNNNAALALQRTGNNGRVAQFYRDTTEVGYIEVGSSSTAYATSSDYRLKENIVDLDNAITRLKELKPRRFNFIGESDTRDGFVAHEVTAVPEAVSGTKDEVDLDNKPVYQGIDQSKIVPLLTAALQEAVTKIETLEAKVKALEEA